MRDERPSPVFEPERLDALPLEPHGVAAVEVFAVHTAGTVPHQARVTLLRPHLAPPPAHRTPLPSCLLERPRLTPLERREERAAFESDGATVRAQVRLPDGARVYGGGEVCGPLELTGRTIRLWNHDAWRYDERTPGLYQSHPWLLAVHAGGATGILADTCRRGQMRVLTGGIELDFEEEPFDLLLIDAQGPREVLAALAALVGPIARPPRWALGYQQCRWGWRSAAEVRRVARELRARRLPCDALWLDIDHMDRRRTLTWDRRRFPDPAGLVHELHQDGFRVVAITNPGVADAPDCELLSRGEAGDHFVKDCHGEPVRGRVWPGICRFPDFARLETRAWWAREVRDFTLAADLDGLWCDMNEPTVFRAPTRTLPEDALHRGPFAGPHRRLHNLYGLWMAEATQLALAEGRPESRPFVLTRANHLGGARCAATWTGDNQARWEDLAWSVPMVLNLGLSGQPFAGADVGGFDGDPEPELFVRWFELGAHLPFFRGHGAESSCRKEPWAFGPAVEAHVRHALEWRTRLVPYLETLMEEAARTGLPVARPLFFADPGDGALAEVDDAFLLGDALLVAPALAPRVRERDVRLPRGAWVDLRQGDRHAGGRVVRLDAPLGDPPRLLRAGHILPLAEPRTRCDEPIGELELHVALDEGGRASGELFEDAGDGPPDAPFRRTLWNARREGNALRLTARVEGSYEPPPHRLRVLVYEGERVTVYEGERSWPLRIPLS